MFVCGGLCTLLKKLYSFRGLLNQLYSSEVLTKMAIQPFGFTVIAMQFTNLVI